jgi:hypothetical protein
MQKGFRFFKNITSLKAFFFFVSPSLKFDLILFTSLGFLNMRTNVQYVFSYFFFHMDNDIIDLSTKKILCVPWFDQKIKHIMKMKLLFLIWTTYYSMTLEDVVSTLVKQ